nr:hypothetical protein FNV92_17990 [Bradyrhizobium cosmicum]
MAMDDDAISDRPRREALQLIKAFLGITDPGKRQRVLRLAEQLADDASYEAAGPGAPTHPGPHMK